MTLLSVLRSPAGGGTVNGDATLTGTGALTATGAITGTATLTGSGTLSSTVVQQAAAGFSGSGDLTATGTGAVQGTATLTGSGTLTALATQRGNATLTGTGSLSAVNAGFGPPADLTAVVVSSTQIDLSWDPTPDASGYDVHRLVAYSDTYGDAFTSVLLATDLAATSYSATGLDPSTEYSFMVLSVHA